MNGGAPNGTETALFAVAAIIAGNKLQVAPVAIEVGLELLPGLLGLLLLAAAMPESPHFLWSAGRNKEAGEVLVAIAATNRMKVTALALSLPFAAFSRGFGFSAGRPLTDAVAIAFATNAMKLPAGWRLAAAKTGEDGGVLLAAPAAPAAATTDSDRPLPCVSTAITASTLPLPCVSTAAQAARSQRPVGRSSDPGRSANTCHQIEHLSSNLLC